MTLDYMEHESVSVLDGNNVNEPLEAGAVGSDEAAGIVEWYINDVSSPADEATLDSCGCSCGCGCALR